MKKFRGDAKFSTWLFQIATNRGKNRFKYLKRRGYFAGRGQQESDDERDSSQRAIPDYSTNPETLLAGKQIQKIVQDAIDDLDPDHKEIVILRDIEGFSYDEIAQMLNLPKERPSRASIGTNGCKRKIEEGPVMMECERISDLFGELHDDEADGEIRDVIRDHLYNCPECREEYKWYTLTVQALGSLETASPA